MIEEARKQVETSQYVMDDQVSQDVAKIIKKRQLTFNNHRRSLLREIQANVAYLVGEQNILFKDGAIQPITNPRQINPVSNLLLPAVQKDVAVATQNYPVFDIVPAGTDDDDKATAIAAQKIYHHLVRKYGKNLVRQQTVLWYDIAGVGWRKVYWDPNKTVLGLNPPEGEPGHNPELPPNEAVVQGEVQIESVPPNQLIYDYRASNLNDLDWIIHCKTLTHLEVTSMFGPEVAEKLGSKFGNAPTESEFEAIIRSRAQDLGIGDEQQSYITPKMPMTAEMQLDSDKYIDYYEYWQRPTKKNPMGLVAMMLADQVVFHAPFPKHMYPHGELPFTASAPLSLGACLGASISRISQARPLQRRYNRLLGQLMENVDVMGNAVIFAPRSAKLRYRTMDNGAGNIIEYDGPVGKPTREPGVPASHQAFMMLAEVRQNLEQLFAFNDVTKGQAPRNIESGRGIMALQDADRTHMQPIVAAFEEADERVAFQAITVALANYEQDRLIHTVGSDFEWTLYELDREQLIGRFNVIVKPLSSMPSNKDVEAEKAFMVWQSGLMGDPNDPNTRIWAIEQMALGNDENILQKHSKQKNFAAKEFVVAYANVKEIALQPGMSEQMVAKEIQMRTFIPHINPFDDDMVHLAAHNEFLIDKYWEMMATQNPIIFELAKNMFLHVMEHQQRVEMIQQAQFERELESQMLIRGTTPAQLAQRGARPDGTKKDKKG